jgi:lipid-A-disaccharide synthase
VPETSESSAAIVASPAPHEIVGSRPLPALLFTAFEPSGDDHAAAVIAELRVRHPDLKMFAWGGPKMEAAGATIIERTGDDAVMGMPGLAKIREHQRINLRIAEWIENNKSTHNVALHIPVDSPAANFPICKIAKERGLKVVHLVAPQIWAWGRWRIHKLRRLTDMVLCLLPFEQEFFAKRNVPSRYIGHMLFDHPLDFAQIDKRTSRMPTGEPRVAIMPGSRPDEIRRNFPFILEVFRMVKRDVPSLIGVIAATGESVANNLRATAEANGGWPNGLSIVVKDTDAVVRWCQLALVKSGTVTLQVARQGKPMVIFYKKSNPILFLLARTILSTKVFSLPNIIADRRIVPEFVPHFGGPAPIVDRLLALISEPEVAERQRHDLAQMLSKFAGMHSAKAAADAIEEVARR